VFDYFSDATDFRKSGNDVVVYDAESEIGVEKCVHHDVVVKLEDLEGEDCFGEENQRKRKQREFCYVVGVGRRRQASEKRSKVTVATMLVHLIHLGLKLTDMNQTD
jgi:hypothetical protein